MTENVQTQIDKLRSDIDWIKGSLEAMQEVHRTLAAKVEALEEDTSAKRSTQNGRLNRVEEELKRVLQKAREDHREAKHIARMFGSVPAALDRQGDWIVEVQGRVEQIEAHLFRATPPGDGDHGADDEAMESLATRLLQLTINDAPIDPQLAVDLARQLVDLDVAELAAPADRAVTVTDAMVEAGTKAIERFIATLGFDTPPVSPAPSAMARVAIEAALRAERGEGEQDG